MKLFGIRFVSSFAILMTVSMAATSSGYILSTRWEETATNGGGLQFGDPTTLTWSFVPDGTPSAAEGPSDLIGAFDAIFGAGPGGDNLTQRPWFTYFEQSFDRWSELSGLSYVYEPNDDGATHSDSGNSGVLGVRGDVRIAGSFQDGNGGVLAFNFFPDNGDMTLDSGDTNIFGNASNNFRALRNIIMHEHGHGIGISHVESNNANFLMEPFLATSFDGPQLDDIRAAHRGYGDVLEKTNDGSGNDVIGNSTSLGTASMANPIVIGTNGGSTLVAATDTDFVSIDQNTDTDFFAFDVSASGSLDVTLQPQGTTYLQGSQGGSQSSFSTFDTSDLTLALFDTNQNLVTTVNDTGAGSNEVISGLELEEAGEYYLRITGTANNMQFYQLSIEFEEAVVAIACDLDGDGSCDTTDMRVLYDDIAAATLGGLSDLDGNGVVDNDDIDDWLEEAGSFNGKVYLAGDTDLDGSVLGNDFTTLSANFGNASTGLPKAYWDLGNFDGDIGGFTVLGSDFTLLAANFGAVSVNAVPEPSSSGTLLIALLSVVGWIRIRS